MRLAEHKHARSVDGRRARLVVLPTTRLGWWAVGLAACFFPLVLTASVVPRGAAFGFASGLAGGVVAIVAVSRDGERAVTVWSALIPLIVGVGFLATQLLAGST